MIASKELGQQMRFWYIYGKAHFKRTCSHIVDVSFVFVYALRPS